MASTYKQIRHEKQGEALEVLELVNVPYPSQPTASDVLVKITASPIHPGILLFITGVIPGTPEKGVPGVEAAGVVVSVGPNVKNVKVGQRVVLGLQVHDGTWSEYIVLPEDKILPYPVPDFLSDAEIAQWKTNPFTAYGLFVLESKFNPGDWALVTAAGSAMGKTLIQFSKILNVPTIAVVRRAEQIEELKKETGVEHVIVYAGGNRTQFLEQIKTITGGRGIKSAFDPVAGETAEAVYESLAEDGQLLEYGALSGAPLNKPKARFHSVLGTFPRPDADEIGKKIWQWILEKKITFQVEKVYPLEQFKEAIKHSRQSGNKGKVLLGSA